MEVIKVTPRGYCYGVVDAMEIARKAARDPSLPRPIHIIGLIVHNRFAVEDLNRLGIVTLDGPDRVAILDQVAEGTVIFTAHGVSPRVKERARERGLHIIDATCPDVTKTHDLVMELAARGYQILYIGKKGHPEPEGVVGEAPDAVYLVENEADLETLPERILRAEKLMVTTQTTLSQWDTLRLIEAIRRRFPHAEVYNEICQATQDRQEAVARWHVGLTSRLSSAIPAAITRTGSSRWLRSWLKAPRFAWSLWPTSRRRFWRGRSAWPSPLAPPPPANSLARSSSSSRAMAFPPVCCRHLRERSNTSDRQRRNCIRYEG